MKKIIFNWKINPDSPGRAVRLARLTDDLQPPTNNKKVKKVEVVICPPFPFLEGVGKTIRRAKLGAQNVFWEDGGAYTGEVAPSMLKNLGVEYVIIGHSERRAWLGETDAMVNKKVLAALQAGLRVILCVGETQRTTNDSPRSSSGEAGQRPTTREKDFVRNQLIEALKGISSLAVRRLPARSRAQAGKSLVRNLAVAYEPVWAISTTRGAKECTPAYAAEMIRFIKKILNSHFSPLISPVVLYGGSVNGKNIKGFLREKDIDGVLVGGASVKPAEVREILNLARSSFRA